VAAHDAHPKVVHLFAAPHSKPIPDP
jgi:hypothetical protein